MGDYPKEPWRPSLTHGRMSTGPVLYGICSDPTNINVAWVSGALKHSDEVLERICAAVNFTAGVPIPEGGPTLGEVLEALAKCEAFIAKQAGGGETEFRKPVRAILAHFQQGKSNG